MFNYNQETIYSLLCAVLPCFIYLLVWGRKKPLLHWVCGLFFMLCALMYCPSRIIIFAVCRLILGGTSEGHKVVSCGGIYAQNRIGRRNLRVEIQVRVNV